MRKYRYILFDLDGTLIHSHEGIFACILHALKVMGREELGTSDRLRRCIGPTLVYSFSHYFEMCEEDAVKATAIYREEYAKTGVHQNQPIQGALETLKALKERGYVLALATSKPQGFAETISKRWGFEKYLSVTVGAGLDGSLPTKASVIEEAVRRLGASADECLMVGDRKHDKDGAGENGIDCAMLKVGYAESEEEFAEANPKYVFETFAELSAFLCEKNSGRKKSG